ncbi:hypothetical protein DL765_009689 [Monosporascus sp. GIB2]|nr:hypothetical protein DL765_009689 [Monosporascus sp. GIB2]
MRLLRRSHTGEFNLTNDFVGDDTIPPYAILSHTWTEDQEVTFQDIIDGTGQSKTGYDKIQFCEQQAKNDGLRYFWVDTCCINKLNYGELQEALHSMFRWYQNAAKCYVYLSDVSTVKRKASDGFSEYPWEPAFRESRWFTRGWTLQELLAPSSLEFFSRERKRLGDKKLLTQQIHKITGISKSALQGAPLSQFSVNERLSWTENRQTKLEEDKAYSLLGIFDVHIPLIYGEGMARAFQRLMDEIDKRDSCIKHLRLTDPRDDKKRIEETKGGLVEDSYHWILENRDFKRWRNGQQNRLLWIKGDPGKGKTMLLCGIINELNKSLTKTDQLSYFFCQATDSRINNATAVLRGLLYSLVDQQPSLVLHIRKKYDRAGKALFEDVNAWVALSEILTNILQDRSLNNTYLIVDALDECVADWPKLLDYIVQKSTISPRVKWIVSSRNWPYIEERLERAGHKVRLCLELNAEAVSTAVSIFVQHKVRQLADKKEYDEKTRDAVLGYLSLNANDTFLWVALVCQNLENTPRRKTLANLSAFPPGLDSLYERMMQQICNSNDVDDADLCKRILASIAVVYRPITLEELSSLVEIFEDTADNLNSLREVINLCGSFLTIRQGTIYFVHQSAKDFLLTKAFNEIFPSGTEEAHYIAFSRSLQVMSRTLRRDMYSLCALGYPAEQVEQPDPDPLAASRYSCIYWVHHLCEWSHNSSTNNRIDLQDGGIVDSFIREKYLYWLEALSLCKSMSEGVVAMANLQTLIKAYASALLFSPTRSLIRCLFKKEEPKWITIKPTIEDEWGACLQTLDSNDEVSVVTFSANSGRLASASASANRTVEIWDADKGQRLKTLDCDDGYLDEVALCPNLAQLAAQSGGIVKIWDVSSGECLQSLDGHNEPINSVAFSHDSARLASGSDDTTVKIWDLSSGECLQTFKGHRYRVRSVTFSHDSARLASGSADTTAKIWDVSSGECLQTLKGHRKPVWSVTFSYNSARLASGSGDNTIKIWDMGSNECVQRAKGRSHYVTSVAFSPDSARLASGSEDGTVIIWDASSSKCLKTLEGHSGSVRSVAFSYDSAWLASGSDDSTVRIWDVGSGECVQRIKGDTYYITSVAFSPNSTRLASAPGGTKAKIWDINSGECLQTLKGHIKSLHSVIFSPDSTQLASASNDNTIKIWDIDSGKCLKTLEGHSAPVWSVAFSYDSARLASTSSDNTVKIWDTGSGQCLQTIRSSKHLRYVSFDINGSYLFTEKGSITINASDALLAGPRNPQYQGLGFSSEEAWITYNSENLVWLPSEYRPVHSGSSSVMSGKTIFIGDSSGRVWICIFESDAFSELKGVYE